MRTLYLEESVAISDLAARMAQSLSVSPKIMKSYIQDIESGEAERMTMVFQTVGGAQYLLSLTRALNLPSTMRKLGVLAIGETVIRNKFGQEMLEEMFDPSEQESRREELEEYREFAEEMNRRIASRRSGPANSS